MTMEKTSILKSELWGIIRKRYGEVLPQVFEMKKSSDRKGRVKRIITAALDESSLGTFNGQGYFFTGKVYEPISIPLVQKVIFDIIANNIGLPDCDLLRMNEIYYDCANCVFAKQLNVNNEVMVFRNGVLDIANNKFHTKFSPQFVQMWSVDYDYNPKARTFLWFQFLNQVLPDPYLQRVLQMFLGATFIDRQKVKIEHLLILLGSGANGKSVVQATVKGVLGEDYVSEQSVGRLCSRGNEGDFAVSEINGKRLNYCTEMETSDFYRKTARLKTIVSGEKTTARRLYSNPFYVTNIPLLMANANALPIFSRQDSAMLRRIYVIPFNVTIPEERQNKSLCDELVAEYPAILNWMLEGRRMFIENDYKLPPDVNMERYVLNVKVHLNSALLYMAKNGYKAKLPNVTLSPQRWLRLVDIYADYERWCAQNEMDIIGKTLFSRILENEGEFVKRRTGRGVMFGVYCGSSYLRGRQYDGDGVLRRKPVQSPEWKLVKDGKIYVRSLAALAAYAGVGTTAVTTLSRSGAFRGCMMAYREKRLYEVDGCINVMIERHVIASDEEKNLLARLSKEVRYHRYVFNQWCQFNGFPYRMYSSDMPQIEDDIITVPDDTTREEAIAMAKKAGYDVTKALRYKETPGAFGRGGKGFFESLTDIPTDEEKKSIKKTKTKKK